MGKCGFKSIIRAEDVNVHDGFEGIGAELCDRCEEVACCSSAGVVCLAIARAYVSLVTYITKSMAPRSCIQRSTAFCKLSTFRTSTAPMPMTFDPDLVVAISVAMRSVFSTFRPIIQALAPSRTSARTWALQIVPAPPVQKTILFPS